jgi:glycosyltransferase involved in cell wall biosynthesis
MTLSVLISVYEKDSPLFFTQALQSLLQQSLQADEVVVVRDGPIGVALEAVLTNYSDKLPLRTLALPTNGGLGTALRAGVIECQHELIARMDADDLSVPDRFRLQVKTFENDSTLDAVGGSIAEFASTPEYPTAVRRLPAGNAAIIRYAKWRNPFNHMTAMFRRAAVINVGSYVPFADFEDYHLWVRMLLAGSRFVNLNEILVYARTGTAMLERRGGFQYAAAEFAFQRFLCGCGFISPARSACNALMRLPVRIAPIALRTFVYQRLLRSTTCDCPPFSRDRSVQTVKRAGIGVNGHG